MTTQLARLACVGFACLVTTSHAASSWHQFRGSNCSGVSPDGNPPVVFGPKTNLVFKVAVPGGASSPCVAEDKVFLTAAEGQSLQTICYDAKSGALLWRAEAPGGTIENHHPTEGSPAASTPAVAGGRVVSYFGSRGVFCYDFAGKEVWRQEMKPASHLGGFGTGSSVVISGNIVLLNRDQLVGSQLLALRLDNGATAWVAERPELVSSYSTPVIWPHDGREEVVVAGSLQLRAYDLQSGAETWRVRGLPPVTCTTPVLGDGILLFAGWANGKAEAALEPFEQLLEAVDKNHDAGITRVEFDTHPRWKGFYATFDTNADQKIVREEWEGARAFLTQGENCMIAVRPGTGDITEKNVIWKQKRGLPYVPSPLLHDGHVYLVKDGGLVSCFDARSGREIYLQERLGAVGTYYSSPVAASNRLYISSQEGKITVIRTGEKPERLAQADLGERLSSTPAIVGESIFYRTAHSLWKFAQQ